MKTVAIVKEVNETELIATWTPHDTEVKVGDWLCLETKWQGLTDDEIEVIDADCWIYPADGSEIFNHYKFARAIETKLKEKNYVN